MYFLGFRVKKGAYLHQESIAYCLLITFLFAPPLAASVIVVVTILFPDVHSGFKYSSSNVADLAKYFAINIFYFISSIPIGYSGLLLCTLSLVTLHCLHIFLLILKNEVKSCSNSTQEFAACKSYRELQTLVRLCDQCFREYIWTNFQFACSAIVIAMMFTTINFGATFSGYMLICVVYVMCTSSVAIFLVLDYASRPLLMSTRLLAGTKRWRKKRSTWTSKFVRSLSPVCLRVGMFHKMDRSRGPATIRFCLQRTFFLVVQSRSIDGKCFNMLEKCA